MIYDSDYYERGLETGKSCYQNYRWVPELTIPMAMTIIDYLEIKRNEMVLDFGCAKGYLVKALRLLYRKAYGIDISYYAISHIDEEIKQFCYLGTLNGKKILPVKEFSICIAKDVFEHINKTDLIEILKNIPSERLFAVIPLGDQEGRFISLKNQLDPTHIICEPVDWWLNFFAIQKWEVEKFTYKIQGIKDSYYETHPKAHGFFTLRKV